MLRDQIQIAKSQVVIRRAGHVKQSTIPYSQTSSQPVSPSASPQTNASPNQSWLSGAWNWIVDDVEKSPGRPASHPPATSEAEWKKIEEILSKCEEFLGKIFHVSVPLGAVEAYVIPLLPLHSKSSTPVRLTLLRCIQNRWTLVVMLAQLYKEYPTLALPCHHGNRPSQFSPCLEIGLNTYLALCISHLWEGNR